jgi:hypothetical protein
MAQLAAAATVVTMLCADDSGALPYAQMGRGGLQQKHRDFHDDHVPVSPTSPAPTSFTTKHLPVRQRCAPRLPQEMAQGPDSLLGIRGYDRSEVSSQGVGYRSGHASFTAPLTPRTKAPTC